MTNKELFLYILIYNLILNDLSQNKVSFNTFDLKQLVKDIICRLFI